MATITPEPYTVCDFCQLNGLDRKTLYASNAKSMNVDTLLSLCSSIGCMPNDLLRGLY